MFGSTCPSGEAKTPDSSDLAARFAAFAPWVTRFEIAGELLGGWYDASHDPRVAAFAEAFPGVASVLELGSLEGGHSIGLASLPGIEYVCGLEGRSSNVERSKFVVDVLGISNVEFRVADLDALDFSSLGNFDAVFNCGLLYHLAEPWSLLTRLAPVSRQMFLSTHYCDEHNVEGEENGYRGRWYEEYGLEDPLSGLGRRSFWPTRDALSKMLVAAGFLDVEIVSDEPGHEMGPLVAIAARRPRFLRLRRLRRRIGDTATPVLQRLSSKGRGR